MGVQVPIPAAESGFDLSVLLGALERVAVLHEKATKLECFETPDWAIEALLDTELLTRHVWDVCCGPGVLAKAAKFRGYTVKASDIFDWGYGARHDFLNDTPQDFWPYIFGKSTCLMNPPFSLAEQFVAKAHELGFRKIVCFQRFAWWESNRRQSFWDQYPPARVYVCGSRATCWKVGTPPEKRKSGTTTAHAWFVYERGQNSHMPSLGRLYKAEAA